MNKEVLADFLNCLYDYKFQVAMSAMQYVDVEDEYKQEWSKRVIEPTGLNSIICDNKSLLITKHKEAVEVLRLRASELSDKEKKGLLIFVEDRAKESVDLIESINVEHNQTKDGSSIFEKISTHKGLAFSNNFCAKLEKNFIHNCRVFLGDQPVEIEDVEVNHPAKDLRDFGAKSRMAILSKLGIIDHLHDNLGLSYERLASLILRLGFIDSNELGIGSIVRYSKIRGPKGESEWSGKNINNRDNFMRTNDLEHI